jgi:hypothetical protein
MLIQCMTGIASANRSHLQFFQDINTYGVYYDLVVELSQIAVANFAERCQSLLVAFSAQGVRSHSIRPTGPGTVAECV